MVAALPCAVCRTPSSRIELVAPGGLPARWEHWPGTVRDSFPRRAPAQWHLLAEGVAAGNGYGDPVDAARPGGSPGRSGLRCASPRPTRPGFYDDAGFCQDCDTPYCCRHWQMSDSGFGYCPAVTARARTRMVAVSIHPVPQAGELPGAGERMASRNAAVPPQYSGPDRHRRGLCLRPADQAAYPAHGSGSVTCSHEAARTSTARHRSAASGRF